MKTKLFFLHLFLVCLFSITNAYSAVFNIVPKFGTTLPTRILNAPVTAYYTVTNTTGSYRAANYVKSLPPNVSQVVTGGTFSDTCGTAFNLNANESCTLQLNITGAVLASDPNPANHLFVCLNDCIICCTGTLFPLNVTAPRLISLRLSPTSVSIANGTSQQFTLTGVYDDNSTQDLSAGAFWTSSNSNVAIISNTGLATGVSPGSATITAAFGSMTVSADLTITPAILTSIQVSPPTASISLNTTQAYTAIGVYSDSTTQDLTNSVTWTSLNTTVASVNSAGIATGLAAGSATIRATVGIISDDASLTVTTASLVSIQVTPTVSSIANGTTQQFTATGFYSDSSTQDLTNSATWTSLNNTIASINSGGLATGLATGTATIRASSGSVSGDASLTVTPAVLVSIQVTPPTISIANGTTQQFNATGVYSDSTTQDLTNSVAWASLNTSVASISSGGLATGLSIGSTTIRATSGSIASDANLDVTAAVLTSIQVAPATASIAKGTTQAFTATGIYSDNTNQDLTTAVTWTSLNTSVAFVSNVFGNQGVATGLLEGSTTIRATLGLISGNASLTVTAAVLTSIQVAPATASIAKGTTQAFTATGVYSDNTNQDLTNTVTWTSLDTSVAIVSDASGSKGVATAILEGSTSIRATSGSISSDASITVTAAVLTTIQVAPATASIAKGTTQAFTATGIYSDSTNQDLTTTVTWTSLDTTVAQVSNTTGNKGVATTLSVGTTTIRATLGSIVGNASLTVTPAVLTTIQVAPATASIAKGTNQAFTATGIYSDNTSQDLTTTVTWTSLDTTVAEVSNTGGNNGLAIALLEGTTTIRAASGSIVGNASLTVTPAVLTTIQVAPATASIAKGTTQAFTATGVYSDNSSQDLTTTVTWTSLDTTVSQISNTGIATALLEGTTTIRAASGSIVGNASLTVTAAVLTTIQVAPATASIAKGTTQAFTATGIYSDNTNQDLTTTVTWTSSDTTVSQVSNTGVATALLEGTTTVSATSGSVVGNASLTVTAAVLTTIQVAPATASIAKGTTQAFTATGIYSDNTNQDLTTTVTWTSLDTTVSQVSNTGVATALLEGTTTIRATSGSIVGNASLTVTAAVLTTIQVAPATASFAKGTTQAFTATGVYSDNSSQDLTNTATWTSLDATVASVTDTSGSKGVATALLEGTTTIRAASGSIVGNASITVTAAVLTTIQVAPATASIAKGTTQAFTATGIYSDNSSQDLTNTATWTSLDTTVSQVSNTGVATALLEGTTTIRAASGSVVGNASLTVTAAVLTSIQVAPATASIAKGTTQAFTATGIYSDNSSQDLTNTATWTSLDTTVSQVSNTGVATALLEGTTTIRAASGSIVGNASLTVTAAVLTTIQVAPTTASIAKGTTQAFTATGIYSDNSSQDLTNTATWTSLDTTVAAVTDTSGNKGVATGLLEGTTTIRATSGSIVGSASLTVTPAVLTTIQVAPSTASIPKGTTQAFTATGIYSDSTNQDLTTTVTWTSLNTTVASVSNATGTKGVARGLLEGSATIRATFGSVSGNASLTITAAVLTSLQVTPLTASIANGTTRNFVATGLYSDNTTLDLTESVTWTSLTPAVATVSDAAGSKGRATGASQGSTTIRAASGSITGDATLSVTAAVLSSIQVSPPTPTIANGTTQSFTATGLYSDNTSQDLTNAVTWTSLTPAVASVSDAAGTKGRATALSQGSTTIRATSGAINGNATLTVTAAALTSLQVTPPNGSIANGTTQPYTAMGVYSDNTVQDLTNVVTWTSLTPAVASISDATGSKGLATGLSQGTTTIRATSGAITADVPLVITAAVLTSIQVSPPTASIAKGTTQAFTATGIYSDNSSQDLTNTVTWSALTPSVASISNAAGSRGVATGLLEGLTTIRATLGSVTQDVDLTVTPAVLASIEVSPSTPAIAKGTTKEFMATGVYSDQTVQNITTSVTWTSVTPTVASISNATGSQGVATGLLEGTTTIRATLGAFSGATTLTITPAVLVAVQVIPATASIAKGTSRTFMATGVYSDNTNQDLTSSATWTSVTPSVASVSNAAGSRGVATGLLEGTTTIRATSGSLSGTSSLTVTAAVLSSIQVTPATASIVKATTQAYVATGVYSDSSTQVITNSVTWTSLDTSIASVSNVTGSRGVATGLLAGSTTITAASGSITGSASLTVTPATLSSIAVTPVNAIIPTLTTRQFTATGTYSDATTQNITNTVTWLSSATSIATISNAGGSKGLATATLSAGTTTISATLGSVSGNTPLRVTNSFMYVTSFRNVSAIIKCQVDSTGLVIGGSCGQTGTGFNNPEAISLNYLGTRAYVPNTASSVVRLCDVSTPTGTLTNCVDTGSGFNQPVDISLNPSNTHAYLSQVAAPQRIQLCQVNSTTGTLSGCQSTGSLTSFLVGVAVNPADTFVYVVDGGTLTYACPIINSTTGALGTCFTTGTNFSSPNAITFNRSGTFAYVSNFNTNNVTVCQANSTTGALSSCVTTAQNTFAGFGNVAFNINSTLAYVPNDVSLIVYRCTVNQANGTLSNCVNSGGTGFNVPEGVAIQA